MGIGSAGFWDGNDTLRCMNKDLVWDIVYSTDYGMYGRYVGLTDASWLAHFEYSHGVSEFEAVAY